jgi:hypothetical protein
MSHSIVVSMMSTYHACSQLHWCRYNVGCQCKFKEIGLEINVEKTKYMLLFRHQNVGQNQDVKIANRLFENVSQFKYLGTTVTNQNLIHEEIEFW